MSTKGQVFYSCFSDLVSGAVFGFTFEYTSMAWTNMHSPEAALDTFVTTSIAMLGFSMYGLIFFSIAGEMLSLFVQYACSEQRNNSKAVL